MNDENIKEQVELIREVFVYAHRYKGRTFVFQIDYGIISHSYFPTLIKDLVTLEQIGIKIVLVPGAKEHIDDILTRYGIEWKCLGGVRITSPQAIPFVKMAAFDAANTLMTILTGHNVSAVIGNWVRARAIGVHEGVDYQEAGKVERLKTELLLPMVREGNVPILPCIGWSAAGKPYNVSSRELAASLARELHADKLFFITDSAELSAAHYDIPDGIEVSRHGSVTRMNRAETARFLEANEWREADEEIMRVRLALHAAEGGVDRVHIVDGTVEGVILKEIFSNLGVGTMIYSNTYQSVRPMRIDDIPDVLRIMEPLVKRRILVRRGEEALRELYPDFVVYETDGSVHGCGALHYFDRNMAELAAVAVDERYEQLGIGRKLVTFLLDRARRKNVKRVFVLTTQTSDWFHALGFQPGGVDDIPEPRQKSYDRSRRSRILIYDL